MNAKLIVQSLQGMRAQILLAFFFAGRAMDVKELMVWTGKPRNAHYPHLNALCGAGLLAKQSLAHNRDIYLLGSEMLPALQAWVAQIGPGNSMGSPINLFGSPDVVVTARAVQEPADQPDSQMSGTGPASEMLGNRTPEEWAALQVALDEYRIIGKKRKNLIACEWINAEYVRAHCEYAKMQPWADQNPVGAAINWMLDHTPVPPVRENGHPENCQCAKCRVDDFMNPGARGKYVSGSVCDTCFQYPCICDEEETNED